MSSAMECYPLVYPGGHAPVPESVICARRGMYPIEYIVIGLSAFPHKLDGFRGEVKIFEAVGLFLVEYYPRKFSLLKHVTPFQPFNIAPAQPRKA